MKTLSDAIKFSLLLCPRNKNYLLFLFTSSIINDTILLKRGNIVEQTDKNYLALKVEPTRITKFHESLAVRKTGFQSFSPNFSYKTTRTLIALVKKEEEVVYLDKWDNVISYAVDEIGSFPNVGTVLHYHIGTTPVEEVFTFNSLLERMPLHDALVYVNEHEELKDQVIGEMNLPKKETTIKVRGNRL